VRDDAGIAAGASLDARAYARIVHHKKRRRITRGENPLPNQLRAIRPKNRFWRATMRREAGGHENFFIAKNRDSESVRRDSSGLR
jgi:hypothetical protein